MRWLAWTLAGLGALALVAAFLLWEPEPGVPGAERTDVLVPPLIIAGAILLAGGGVAHVASFPNCCCWDEGCDCDHCDDCSEGGCCGGCACVGANGHAHQDSPGQAHSH
jgi:hypothetical protein